MNPFETKSVGIIGKGAFGSLLYDIVHSWDVRELTIYDTNADSDSLDAVCMSDVIFIAVPFDSLEDTLATIADTASQYAIVIDVLSVKIMPVQLMQEILPEKMEIIASHPLFGPESYKDSTKKPWVLESIRNRKFYDEFRTFIATQGFAVHEVTADEHDRQMATSHALTFFVGRSLLNMDLEKPELTTGYSNILFDLIALESKHSKALFETIQLANPYAKKIRQQFIDVVDSLNNEITE